MSSRGFFLVLEGVEGAGKTTQARLLSRWMAGRRIAHRIGREPGGTRVGEAIRRVLLDAPGTEIPAETELLLLLAARAAFVRDIVRPALMRGEVMIADRFELSSLAYQGCGRGLDPDAVRALNAFATGAVRPDLTLVLDLPVAAGLARQTRAGKARDRIEGEGEAWLERVREAYWTFAEGDAKVRLIDASGTEADVGREVRKTVEAALPESFFQGRG